MRGFKKQRLGLLMFCKKIAIQCVDVTKKYSLYDNSLGRLKAILFNKYHSTPANKQFTALNSISFSITQGQTVGIIGENGSGKSTLLQIICGITTADEGHVEIQGRVAALLELGAGFNPEFTGKENVFMNAALLGLSRKETEHRYDQILAFADIGEFIDRPVKVYSSGMYIRLAFSVAINVSPDILIIDEALSVGDSRFQSKCFLKIDELKKSGTTILFVSHDINTIRQFCDHLIWLEKGQIKMAGRVLDVSSKYMQYLFDDNNTSTHPTDNTLKIENPALLSNPINHWGSHLGSILSCQLLDSAGQQKNTFVDNAMICIRLCFKMPYNIKLAGFGATFAIRALNGIDLIVHDTFNHGISFSEEQSMHEVQFSFINSLNEGKYMLVAVLEDRSGMVPTYYEFIEGVQFFSVKRSKTFFGLFVPKIELAMRVIPAKAGCQIEPFVLN